ncbi:MAG: site-specific DNA-methyltransferase [Flavobacteriaceae bacterium]|nr:site-specific DNA-methyltransferase [Flavobacteriaceae bacterium]
MNTTIETQIKKKHFEPYRISFGEVDAGLYVGDCLLVMDQLIASEVKVDMIFADPPYFLSNNGISCQNGKMVSVNKGQWDKSKGAEGNHHFNLAWLSKCQELLKKNGTVWVSGTHHVIHSVGFAMQQLGYKILNSITWEKPNPPPNLSCRYFTHATETILWASKNEKSKHYFNYDLMKQENGGKQMKSVWTMTAPGKAEKQFGKHPTQKPLKLLNRIIQSSSKENDTILDPFSGSGTTGVSALINKRHYIGIELDNEFHHLTRKRIESQLSL